MISKSLRSTLSTGGSVPGTLDKLINFDGYRLGEADLKCDNCSATALCALDLPYLDHLTDYTQQEYIPPQKES